MKQQRFKNLILSLMFLICFFLSSQLWLKLPNFLTITKQENIDNNPQVDIDLWKIVVPNSYIVNKNGSYTKFYKDNEYDFYNLAIESLENALDNYDDKYANKINGVLFPKEYLRIQFESSLPVEIFTGELNVNESQIKRKLTHIESIIFGINENDSVYVFDGTATIKIKNPKIDNSKIIEKIKQFDFSNYPVYKEDVQIDGINIPIPIPNITEARNPIFVKSELDITDKSKIEDIAKSYFDKQYDFVRTVKEINGSMAFVYKNEKVLKINADGLLEFSDSNYDLENSTDPYKGLMTALEFSLSFLSFPDDGYLSSVESVQLDGSMGYRFIFSYRVEDRPILFSKLKNDVALKVDVIGDKVVSYKRYMRDVDKTHEGDTTNVNIISAENIILQNLDKEDPLLIDDGTLRVIKKSTLNEINNIYLGYFDLSGRVSDQLLNVVWVIETNKNTYIFNAITGFLIEQW